MDEAVLLEKIRQNANQALRTFVADRHEQALRVAFRYLRNWEAAADCVQDAFLKVAEQLGRKPPPQNFSAWFFRILVNRCLDELRSARRRQNTPLESQGELPVQGFEEGVHAKLTAQVLLAQLKPSLRSVLILHDLEGFSFGELAQILGRSESAVRGLLFRARKKLAKQFAELQK